MTAYFVRRLLLVIPTFIGVTLIAYTIMRYVPGGPLDQLKMQARMAQAEGGASIGGEGGKIPKEALEAAKKAFHLDKHVLVAYALWLRDACTGNLGTSYFYQEPVSKLVTDRFPVSIYFGLSGFLIAYLVSIPLGIVKALKHGESFDFVTSAIVFIGYSIPGWAIGTLLLVLFAGGEFLDVFPLGGFRSTTYNELPEVVQKWEDPAKVEDKLNRFRWNRMGYTSKLVDQVWHTVLPVFCYMMGSFATLTILMKNSLMENIGQDYVRTAFAKGLHPRRVVFLHVLRNSLIPLATGLGHAIGIIMAGSYLIELVFNIEGLGMLGFNSIGRRDYTVVMGVLAINTMLTLIGNILSDILYALIDPRIRFQ